MQMVIDWIMSHQGVLAAFVVALLDLVFALVPSWDSNGLLHWVYLQLQKLIPPKQ